MIKLVVSDLDETLVGPTGVSEVNIQAIKKATALGVKFVPNTGRGFQSVQPLLEQLGLRDQPDEYVISYNGGAIVENKDCRVLQVNALSATQATQIFDVVKQRLDYATHIYTLNHVYVYNPDPEDTAYMTGRGVKVEDYPYKTLEPLAGQPIVKIITMNHDPKKREAIRKEVLGQVDFDLNATFSSNRYTEFNLGGVDKGKATLALAKRLGIQKDEIMALGDNNNDIAMLSQVGLPVVVANATADARRMAKHVTQGDFTSGVAEAIHQFILED
ncbi:Cof-type HAD-IIB family hydrolase [Pediococcus acidilactici]|uniref:Cof-type HAD-IIB family hydrolase n=1 Tax=Pediococcus acidilactici TaxID=1254 RepID=UPI0003270677|nr:Cof-type HAD-IIB family hydrolase [Pediococcus acidilactici]EOA08120.1 Cof-like hydrolase [Pediococcus acidilactici D3]MBW4796495.1 Cof-type HAD-IIB family hydrolase [Pediococcus acidilactici]MBW9305746.1 Cof-type HAD-IIB family hydrolase [Pediococcus acidilactici]MCE5962906.1 Cof-type HAD-IIB family hydrolase [Pediococcus acidilactici]MCW8082775.1 Cof-type HAD-IIB family hydrolase [Pediococcus acidilactici]